MSKEDEVFKASVQMSLLFETDNLLKVGMINVRINPKQPLEYRLYHIPEVHWKRSTCSKIKRNISVVLPTSIDNALISKDEEHATLWFKDRLAGNNIFLSTQLHISLGTHTHGDI
jgi:hypothetical protein